MQVEPRRKQRPLYWTLFKTAERGGKANELPAEMLKVVWVDGIGQIPEAERYRFLNASATLGEVLDFEYGMLILQLVWR